MGDWFYGSPEEIFSNPMHVVGTINENVQYHQKNSYIGDPSVEVYYLFQFYFVQNLVIVVPDHLIFF